MNRKKRSVFQLFMIPLIFIIMAQALLTYWIIYSSGTLSLIDESSISTLRQTVRNRRIIIENNMIQQWSNVDEEVDTLNSRLQVILETEGITLDQFIQNPEYQQEFLENSLQTCLYMMRKNSVTGAFVILANEETGSTPTSLEGVYFRDADPLSNPGDYSDVLMERGDSSFSHKLGIPFNTLWKQRFYMEAAGSRESDNFFFKPYLEAVKQPSVGYSDLDYWSRPFCLESNVSEDSYRMMTYSVPLLYHGRAYGVLGVEISVPYFLKYLPKNELDQGDENGYLLLEKTADGRIFPLIGEGTSEAHRMENSGEIELRETKYRGLLQIISDEDISGAKLYAYPETFHLYNSNAPFSDTVWMLAGFRSSESLFGVREDIVHHLFLSLFIALLFGMAGSYLTVRMVAYPINRLEKCIQDSPENEMLNFEDTGVREVDSLAGVVRSLTENQKQSENRLIEEKERYRLALESSTDVMFTYDLTSHSLDMLNLKKGGVEVECVWDEKRTNQLIFDEDKGTVRFLFHNIKDNMVIQFRARFKETDEFQWQEMTCRTIYDTDNHRSKIIGRVRNIHEEKLEELKRQEEERRDPVTGLLSGKYGIEQISKDMKKGGGVLVLMDVDRFRELNEKFGMVFGDAIMEEIGRIIRSIQNRFRAEGRELAGIRAGGDEMLLWLPKETEEAALEAVDQLRNELSGTYGGESPQVTLSYGISAYKNDGREFEGFFKEACQALYCSKRAGGGQPVIYGKMTKTQRDTAKNRTAINEIASLSYTDKLNMVSQVFNFFDKSNDVHAIIPVLLVKLGNYYNASHILVMQTDREFHTSYAAYQWNRDKKALFPESVCRFGHVEYQRLAGAAQEGVLQFGNSSEIDAEKRRFLFIPDDCSGICISMYDKGVFMGTVVFLCDGADNVWEGAAKNELVEITKLIETNINNQRYDLASRAKSDFLSRMSHEIRTPMNAIIGMTEIAMKRQENPEAVEDCLRKIDSSSKYLLNLINDILDMSKIESGKMKLVIGDFSMNELLGGIDSMIRTQAEERGLKFICDTEITEDWISGDALHLNQVVINLLSNALKFTPRGGIITLTVKQTVLENGIDHYFSVRDTGAGIRQEDIKRIFNSFEQADHPSRLQAGGTGLGLTISSRFVRMMGGEIEVKSEVEKGSEFYFRVLLRPGVEMPENLPVQNRIWKEEEISFKGKRILLVEDNDLNAEIAQTILSMHEAEVDTAENGQEAVDRFLAHGQGYYNLILMDVCMPVMDGLEATREIRKSGHADSASVPIIAMSANAFDEDMKKSIESGMNGHLAKPIDVPEFLRVIANVL